MPSDPPSVGMLHMPMCFVHYDTAYPGYPQINNDDQSGCAPPFQKSRSAPVNSKIIRIWIYLKANRRIHGILHNLPKHPPSVDGGN